MSKVASVGKKVLLRHVSLDFLVVAKWEQTRMKG